MNRRHKVGVFGGTFDPLHIGHLIIARAALEELCLEKVVFVPSGRPPHKADRRGASDEDRIRMLEAALADEPCFDIDLLEIGSREYTYSYLTMKKLCAAHPENDYYFLMGEDSLHDLDTWRNPEELVRYCRIAAAGRKGFSDIPIEELMKQQSARFGGTFLHVECPFIDLSSSEIRSRVSAGRSIRYYTVDTIMEYISRNGLYRNV